VNNTAWKKSRSIRLELGHCYKNVRQYSRDRLARERRDEREKEGINIILPSWEFLLSQRVCLIFF